MTNKQFYILILPDAIQVKTQAEYDGMMAGHSPEWGKRWEPVSAPSALAAVRIGEHRRRHRPPEQTERRVRNRGLRPVK